MSESSKHVSAYKLVNTAYVYLSHKTQKSFYYNVIQEAQKFSTSQRVFFQESSFCKVPQVPIKLGSLFTQMARYLN